MRDIHGRDASNVVIPVSCRAYDMLFNTEHNWIREQLYSTANDMKGTYDGDVMVDCVAYFPAKVAQQFDEAFEGA